MTTAAKRAKKKANKAKGLEEKELQSPKDTVEFEAAAALAAMFKVNKIRKQLKKEDSD